MAFNSLFSGNNQHNELDMPVYCTKQRKSLLSSVTGFVSAAQCPSGSGEEDEAVALHPHLRHPKVNLPLFS